MADEKPKPIQLDYARAHLPRPTPAEALAPVPVEAQPALKDPVSILQNTTASNIAFASRALRAAGITAAVAHVPPVRDGLLRKQMLMVESVDRDRALPIIQTTLARRSRVASLPKADPKPYKTRSEGGTWPDLYLP